MKKYLLFTILAAFVFVGCEKEKEKTETKTENETKEDYPKELFNVKWRPVKHVDLANNTVEYTQDFDTLFPTAPSGLVNKYNQCSRENPWWIRFCLADTCKSREMMLWNDLLYDTLSNICCESHGFYSDYLLSPVTIDTLSKAMKIIDAFGTDLINIFKSLEFRYTLLKIQNYEIPSGNTLLLYYDNNTKYLQFERMKE
ncbi:MAG: hypothetical protein J6Y34_00140 [Bacteroidales bacterium]|jgi:hypothetical protein|nr:hypothetical protein [Bacteroidales bacterium]